MTDLSRDEIVKMAREAAARHGHTLKDVPEQATVEFITELVTLARADLVAENGQLRALLNIYNLGGWTDSLALIAERDQLRAELAAIKAREPVALASMGQVRFTQPITGRETYVSLYIPQSAPAVAAEPVLEIVFDKGTGGVAISGNALATLLIGTKLLTDPEISDAFVASIKYCKTKEGVDYQWHFARAIEAAVLAKLRELVEALESNGIVIRFDDQGNALVDHYCEGPIRSIVDGEEVYGHDQLQTCIAQARALGQHEGDQAGYLRGLEDARQACAAASMDRTVHDLIRFGYSQAAKAIEALNITQSLHYGDQRDQAGYLRGLEDAKNKAKACVVTYCEPNPGTVVRLTDVLNAIEALKGQTT